MERASIRVPRRLYWRLLAVLVCVCGPVCSYALAVADDRASASPQWASDAAMAIVLWLCVVPSAVSLLPMWVFILLGRPPLWPHSNAYAWCSVLIAGVVCALLLYGGTLNLYYGILPLAIVYVPTAVVFGLSVSVFRARLRNTGLSAA